MDDLELRDGRADLWVVPVPDVAAEPLLSRLSGRLSAEEIEAARRYVSQQHTVLYAVAHAALRAILARYLGCSERAIAIERGEHGRPEVAGRPLRFNLSHAHGMALVGVTAAAEIGVDVEPLDPRRRVERLAPAVMSQEELRAFDGTAESFFEVWTLKEAYAKARGAGLTLGFRNFGFAKADPPALDCDPRFDDPADWRFLSWAPRDGYRAAAAVRSGRPVEWRRFELDLTVLTD